MNLFIDECLSPDYAVWLNDTGDHDAIHPAHRGRRGEGDHSLLAQCIAEDRVIVTENAGDFRKLAARTDIHPGLIILPSLGKTAAWALLQTVMAAIQARGNWRTVMVNTVVEATADGAIAFHDLPAPATAGSR